MASGLSAALGVPVIRSDQSAAAPPYPYLTYTVTTVASANAGTWQRHADGYDRKYLTTTWSITALAEDWAVSVNLAVAARDWLEHTGHVQLSDAGVIVARVTDVNNRDNVLTVEYERRNGFDVTLRMYDVVSDPRSYIDSAQINGGMDYGV